MTLTSLLCQGVMINSVTLNRKVDYYTCKCMQYIYVDAQHIAERNRKHRPENDSTSLLTVSAKARLST